MREPRDEMNEQMPNFEWTDEAKQRLTAGSSVTWYWEFGVEVLTLYDGGVFCPNDAVPKLRMGRDRYVPLNHCDPKTLAPPRSSF